MLILTSLFCGILIFLLIYIPDSIQKNSERQAEEELKSTIDTLAALREMYAENLDGISSKDLDRLKPYFEYKSIEKHLRPKVPSSDIRAKDPFPIKVIHKLSRKLEKLGVTLEFYSPEAFYRREDPDLNEAQLNTWKKITENPGQTISEIIVINGETFKQVSKADTLNHHNCLECHQRYDEGFKHKSWKKDDTRSVIVARKSIQPYIDSSKAVSKSIIFFLVIMLLLSLLLITFIMARRKNFQLIRYQASHDNLTGLTNKQYFISKTRKFLKKRPSDEDNGFVLYIDLDGFKAVNDTYGHEAGDWVLKVAASRFTSLVRDNDVVSRLGGDEFCMLLKDFGTEEDITSISKRIVEKISEKIEFKNKTLYIGCSIGVASTRYYFDDEIDNLLKAADKAMYTAKQNGKNTYSIADSK